jgi:molybdate transport system substrate-binding protein
MGKPVAKLKVMCARSMHEVVTALAYDFTRETGHEVELSFATVGALQKRLDKGETSDVLISAVPAIDHLMKTGALVSASKTLVATTRIGVAICEGAVVPDISTPDAFKNALVAAKAIAFSDAAVGGSAGVYLAGMFADLGLEDAIKAKGLPQQSGGEVASRVAEGKADIGMTLIAEIMPIRGVRVLGPLPAPLGLNATYCAAVMTGSHARGAAHQFIHALTRPTTREVWKQAGFISAR